MDEEYDSLEQAARGDVPARFATAVGHRVEGDWATVWLLTNDRPPFEPYEVTCERRDGRWQSNSGVGGFGVDTPDDVLAVARRLGWS